MKKKLLSIFALSIFSLTFAQVGIGTKTPDKSASLDVDANINGTLKGGLLTPRVALTAKDDKKTIADPATGLIVYNNNGTIIPVGHYIWSGFEWFSIDTSPVTDDKTLEFSLDCSAASLRPAIYKTGESYTGVLSVPYFDGNGVSYDRGDADQGPINGLLYRLRGGKLNPINGTITYSVSGTPTSDDPTVFSIEPAIPSYDTNKIKCNAEVGTGITIRTIKYSEKTVELDNNTTIASETKMGNLRVRYNSGSDATKAGHIEFTTIAPTHVTWIYHKSGYQQAAIEAYGQTASSNIKWYTFLGEPNNPGDPNYDPNRDSKGVTSVDQYNKEHTNMDAKNASNLNPTNRDLGYATLTLHNTNEVYRVTLNASGAIDAFGTVPAKKASVTIFIEQLEATK